MSDVSIDPRLQLGGRFIGDYTALAMGPLLAHPVWTDTRVRQPDPSGALVQQQDLFTSALPWWSGLGGP